MVNCNYKIVFALTHIICIRVAAAAEEVIYKVVAEPQEPRGKPRSRRLARSPLKAQLTLVLSNRLKASPGAWPVISNYDTYICLYYSCIRFRNCLKP